MTTTVGYDALTNYLVSETADTNGWANMCKAMDAFVQMGYTDANVKGELKLIEQRVKADFGITALPAAWRSAKSTAMSAVRMGIPLLFADGTTNPKSAVDKMIKEMRTAADPAMLAAPPDEVEVDRDKDQTGYWQRIEALIEEAHSALDSDDFHLLMTQLRDFVGMP